MFKLGLKIGFGCAAFGMVFGAYEALKPVEENPEFCLNLDAGYGHASSLNVQADELKETVGQDYVDDLSYMANAYLSAYIDSEEERLRRGLSSERGEGTPSFTGNAGRIMDFMRGATCAPVSRDLLIRADELDVRDNAAYGIRESWQMMTKAAQQDYEVRTFRGYENF